MPKDTRATPTHTLGEPGQDWAASCTAAMLEATQHGFDGWTERLAALTTEAMRFIEARWSADLAALSEVAGCRTPNDLFDVQRRFAVQAAEEYTSEIGKLSQMMLSPAAKGGSTLEETSSKRHRIAAE